ncbi:geranylgeranyltransferase type I beta-subunit-like protein [Zopfochytrium polystomum]|nr:geranylgeranyltransferase type I beta-subunit-like protein [Zopfochytrium polystomum]
MEPQSLVRKLDAKYFRRCLNILPEPYTDLDASRLAAAFFGLSGLDLIGALDNEVKPLVKADWIDWIYAQQVLPLKGSDSDNPPPSSRYGFRSGPWSGVKHDPHATHTEPLPYDASHLAMTYTALANLLILGDDLSRVNRKAITVSLRKLQQEDGCFLSSEYSGESDMRFLYSACASSFILNDWSGIDVNRAVDYIVKSQTYDGVFGQRPGQEGHGGSTYCAIASLKLMGKLEAVSTRKNELVIWLLNRQSGGFAGRPAKAPDTCYSFWIGAALDMLDAHQFIDAQGQRDFLKTTLSERGGLSKYPGGYPDILHAYMGFAGLSIMGEPGVQPIHAALNISMRAFDHLQKATVFWTGEKRAGQIC